MNLIDNLIEQGWLKTSSIIQALHKIKRADFLPEQDRKLAELNEALPIGYGQTISQPLVVAFMLELLQPKIGDRILDIGSGSGWTSALLAYIVSGGELKSKIKGQPRTTFQRKVVRDQISKISGKVIAIEIIPELMEFGKQNVAKYSFIKDGRVQFICADGSKGYEKETPFDKILASASAKEIPKTWKEQLKVRGRIVTPIGSSIWLFIKKTKQNFEEIEYPGFAFVPLI